jgi:aminoglycoside/choline kinase family phosphotransferase
LTVNNADSRQQLLEQWLTPRLGNALQGQSASSDASFRRYFRYPTANGSVVAMDAPPETEDCGPFVAVAQILAAADIRVPDILEQDIERGFLLLSDLGRDTFLDRMSAEHCSAATVDALFTSAIDMLVQMQSRCSAGQLPRYDELLLRRDLGLFDQWFLQRHLGLEITPARRVLIDQLFAELIEQILSQATCFVHRDFMPRNLMLGAAGETGLLDFQDAVAGPVSYDVACLFKDAFISWPEPRIRAWLLDYWGKASAAGVPVPATFEQFHLDVDIIGVQRHLKVLGIFSRICLRDGKPQYLDDAPRFLDYLTTVAARRPQLAALAELLDSVRDWMPSHSETDSAL